MAPLRVGGLTRQQLAPTRRLLPRIVTHLRRQWNRLMDCVGKRQPENVVFQRVVAHHKTAL